MPEDLAQLESLLRILIQLTARSVFPEEQLQRIIMAPGTSQKHLAAYNLCNGTRTQAEVARKAQINDGNFSRTVGRWIELGVMYRKGSGREAKLFHLYPLTKVRVKPP